MRIIIGNTRALGSDPFATPCRVGRIVGQAYGRGDLTIMLQGSYRSKQFMNKEIFKQALLQNKDFIRENFDIEIKDLTKNETLDAEYGDHVKNALNYKEPVVEKVEKATITQEEPMVVVYDDMTNAQLKELLKEKNVPFPSGANKTVLLELLRK